MSTEKPLEGQTVTISAKEIADFWKEEVTIPKSSTLEETWEMHISQITRDDQDKAIWSTVKFPDGYGSLFPMKKEFLKDIAGAGQFIVRLRNKLSNKFGSSIIVYTDPELERTKGRTSPVAEKPKEEKEGGEMEMSDYMQQQLKGKDDRIKDLETQVSTLNGQVSTEKMNLITANGTLTNERVTWNSDKLRFERDILDLKAANEKQKTEHKEEIEKKEKEHKEEVSGLNAKYTKDISELTAKYTKEIEGLKDEWKKKETASNEKIENLQSENKTQLQKIGVLDVELTKATLAANSKKGEGDSNMMLFMKEVLSGKNNLEIEKLKSKDAKEATMMDFMLQIFTAQKEAEALANTPTNLGDGEGGEGEGTQGEGIFDNPSNLLGMGLKAFVPALKGILAKLGLTLTSEEEVAQQVDMAHKIGIDEGAEATKKAIEKRLKREGTIRVLKERAPKKGDRKRGMPLGGPEEGIPVDTTPPEDETPEPTPNQRRKSIKKEPEQPTVRTGRRPSWSR
ncbi:MAG: hypothetical protein PHX21_12745 [bacterium]|nr:hypothetical protein [bacterium]